MATAWLYWGSGLLLALGGVALLGWSVFGDRARGRKRCPKCWYDMQRAISLRCPECGHSVKQRQQFFRTRRRWRWAAASMAVFLLAGIIAVQPKVQRDGWSPFVPNTVLLALFSSRHHEWAKEHLWERMLIDSGRRNLMGVIRVQSPDRLSRWQWRWLARQLITMLQRDDLVAAQYDDYVHHLHFACEAGEDDGLWDSAYQSIRSLFDHEDVDVAVMAFRKSIDPRDPFGSAAFVAPYFYHETPELAVGAVIALFVSFNHDQDHAALPFLIEALDSPHGLARRVAMQMLDIMIDKDELSSTALERIRQLEHDPDEQVRSHWILLMGKFEFDRLSTGAHHRFALRMLQSDDVAQRRGALEWIKRYGLGHPRFNEWLLRAFRDEDAIVRREAALLVQSIPENHLLVMHRPLMEALVLEIERGHDVIVDEALQWFDQLLGDDDARSSESPNSAP